MDNTNSNKKLERCKGDIEKFLLIFEASNEGFFYMDKNNNVKFYNTSFYENFDVELENSTLTEWSELIYPEDRKELNENMLLQMLNRIDILKSQYRVKNKKDEYVWIEAIGKIVLDKNNEIDYMIGSHTDITERKRYEERIQYLAYHDETTGLYNRNKIKEVLTQELKYSLQGYFIYLDINYFRMINDSMNFHTGDEVLKIIGDRLRSTLPSESYIARNYSDEFMIVVNKRYVENKDELAQKILKIIKQPININGRIINLDVRIGVLNYPGDGSNIENIFLNAQTMVSIMKDSNILGISYYNGDLQKAHLRKLGIEGSLANAIYNKEIYLNFQPIMDLKNNKIYGFEALMRWRHPSLDQINPDEFIPIAEKNQIINDLGDYVLEEACLFGAKLRKLNIDAVISVNVSPIQLKREDYVSQALAIIDKTGFDKNLLSLEITESTALDASILTNITKLHNEGIKLSIDDFGSGYSSLNSIVSIPISHLKVDRSLICKASDSIEAMKMLELLVSYSHVMNYKIVAEGIENDTMLNKVLEADVDYGQGYYFSKPLLSEDILGMIRHNKLNV